MSHTSYFTIGGKKYWVIHNGDWSGEATIHSEETSNLAQVPGELLVAIGRRATLQEVAGLVETLMGKEAVPIEPDPPPTVNVTVNGRKLKLANHVSYWEIVKMVQPKRPDAILSVVYDKGPKDNREGTLAPGERIGVCEGMHISAYDTSNA